ncbi:MAG: hypothetical protein V2A78_02760 [bacterium]
MPESKPDIRLDGEGICNVCREAEKAKAEIENIKPLESDFVRILNKYKGKFKYECLVMCSGGKDSTSTLYYMKKRYKLNPLAFTFDHGFETEDAMENVRNAVDILGLDWLFFKSDYMKDMFAGIIKSKSKAVICHLCSIWYMQLTFDIAARYDIPIIIGGWTKGQSTTQGVMTKCACNISSPEYASMSAATRDFLATLANDPKYKDFPASMEELLIKANKRHKSMVLSPHWFLDVSAEEYTDMLRRELKWKFPRLSYPAKTTNCYLNFLSVHNSLKYYGYSHYHIEMSKMIRANLMTREEALANLAVNYDRQLLEEIGGKLGCTID